MAQEWIVHEIDPDAEVFTGMGTRIVNWEWQHVNLTSTNRRQGYTHEVECVACGATFGVRGPDETYPWHTEHCRGQREYDEPRP